MNLHIEYLPVDALVPYEGNPRAHDEYDVEQIKISISKYGFNDPIGIWSDHNVIVEGHGRLEAAKELGLIEVPVIRLDHLSEKKRREYAIMHNKTAELSRWDFDALEKELAEIDLSDFDVDFGNGGQLSENVLAGMFEDAEPRSTEDNSGAHPVICPCCGETFFVNNDFSVAK